ncbi:MAG: bifunctional folylpolyglutamate synthase/dihydrofolate synthase [Proteobacteria bacterium]|nr:MAG: bifunctional folylpolyglutamate synthase/dihydrofolate synthase [Pseudomonadota bacterium]
MPNLFQKYKKCLNLKPIIHVIGTNGKGSTGRWLSLMLARSGAKVGHFTSPHVLEYNERFWKNGSNVSYEELDKCHFRLLEILGEDSEKLSYFEYSVFLSALVFEDCDFVVLEAGLGGEYDATNVFSKRLSLVTPIGFDHEEFLGSSLKEIATTKLNSINTNTIISPQNDEIILKTALKIAQKKGVKLKLVTDDLDLKDLDAYMEKYQYPSFFKNNLLSAFAGAKELGVGVDWEDLPPLDLVGRCQKISSNITIDVGHNPLSAKEVVKNFKEKSVVLIYNSYQDKNIENILSILEPIISSVKIFPLQKSHRELGEDTIIKNLEKMGINWDYFDNKMDKNHQYLVFGSFYVVGEFLKSLNEK